MLKRNTRVGPGQRGRPSPSPTPTTGNPEETPGADPLGRPPLYTPPLTSAFPLYSRLLRGGLGIERAKLVRPKTKSSCKVVGGFFREGSPTEPEGNQPRDYLLGSFPNRTWIPVDRHPWTHVHASTGITHRQTGPRHKGSTET